MALGREARRFGFGEERPEPVVGTVHSRTSPAAAEKGETLSRKTVLWLFSVGIVSPARQREAGGNVRAIRRAQMHHATQRIVPDGAGAEALIIVAVSRVDREQVEIERASPGGSS